MRFSGLIQAITFGMLFGVNQIVHANLITNGSFEDLNNTFINTSGNYMSLAAGSSAIAGWVVSSTTTNALVWGKLPTIDGHQAADGSFFIDLTGFGSNSPNGALVQTLPNLAINQQYAFSIDVEVQGPLPAVTVGGVTISLSAGTPFVVGVDTWTPESGFFVANTTNPLLQIMNQQPGQQINFIDNVVVSAVPIPAAVWLFGSALAGFGFIGKSRSSRINA
jgi:hypothetical protein